MDKLSEIFRRQAAYVHSLRPTYLHNGFKTHAESFPFDIDNRKAQEEFRLLAWRCTEEVVEAMETWHGPRANQYSQYTEEVADALHFFIELCLLSGVTEAELASGMPCANLSSNLDQLDELFRKASHDLMNIGRSDPWYAFIRALGLAMFELRQRPWRTDYRQSNRGSWVMGLHLAFQTFIRACFMTNMTAEELHRAYFGKADVNDKRVAEYGV